MRPQRLAALVDGDRFLQLDLAAFEPGDDGLELLQRLLEAEPGDLGAVRPGDPGGLLGHGFRFPV
jgi:hypothetical protein